MDGGKYSRSSLDGHQRRGRVLLGILHLRYVPHRQSHGDILWAPWGPLR